MKKRVLSVLMILCLTTGLLPTTALAGNSSATMHTVTLAYNESLCTVSAYELQEGEDGFNDPTYKNQLVTGNGQSAQVPVGTWLLFEITDIQSSYRIGKVTLNGADRTEGFVNGGYGSLSFTTMAQDYNLAVTIEPIPDSLPTVTAVTLSTDAGGQHPAEDNITYTAESTAERLYGKATFSDDKTYPNYYARGQWQYSTDGVTWHDTETWGSNRFDFWPGWAHHKELNFLTENYDIRLKVMPQNLYTTGAAVYSNVIHVNGGANEPDTTLSDGTDMSSTRAITRAQMAEMVYEHASLKTDIDSMAGGETEPNFIDTDNCTPDQKAAITALYKAKIISGTTAETFNPTDTVTRGEFAVVLWRATGCRSNTTAMTGTLTGVEGWYSPAVNCFYGAGLIQGSTTNDFMGEDPVSVIQVNFFLTAYANNKAEFIRNTISGSTTRAEMTVEIYEKFQPELSKLAVTRAWENPFTDLFGCTEEQINAIRFFYEREIINGTTNTTFHPHTPVTNFQIAALLKMCATKTLSAETPAAFSLFSADPQNEQTPFAWLEAQGLDVSAAEGNPNAPALTATLITWRDGLAPDAPTFSPEINNTFEEPLTVTISAAAGDESAAIYYTTDGNAPTTSSASYSGPFTITDTTTVKAIAVKNNLISEIATATYTKQTQEPEQPALSITASATSLNGSGTITLTTNKAADSVTCSDSSITVTGNGTNWTAILPNATATYTFTAQAGEETAFCTVSVIYQGSGNAGNGSNSSSSVTSGVSGSGNDVSVAVSSSSVSVSQLKQAVGKADSGSTITIGAQNRAAISLPSGGLRDAADNYNNLTIELKNGHITLSPEALSAVTEQAGTTTVTLTMEPVNTAELNSHQQAVVGDAPVFDLTIESGGETISNFDGGLATVSIPYELPDHQDPTGVVVWFMDDESNITPCETMYNLRTKSVIFTTGHFSKYVIGYVTPMDFIDISENAYYYNAVAWAVENVITNGTNEAGTIFSPDVTVSRAQMVTFLWRAYGSPRATGTSPFTDVSTSDYYYDAVMWAVENGITTGTSATTFNPDHAVTRSQAVTFQWRAAGSPVVSGSAFDDVTDNAYYAEAVTWAVASGITNGTNGNKFSPNAAVSRAQAVTFLWRELAE